MKYIFGQSFTSAGARIGTEFKVSSSNSQIISITSFGNDNYIVSWSDGSEIYCQILDSTGKKLGNQFIANTFTTSYQNSPSVSSLINTNFVVAWDSYSQDGSGWGVFGKIYQNNGSEIGFNTCPLNCQSCTNSTYCNACDPNFELQSNGLCGCFNGSYLDTLINLCTSKSFHEIEFLTFI